MKLLIIGGTGFFGKSIMHSYLKGQLDKFNINQVYILSRSTKTFLKSYPEFINSTIEFISGDISIIKDLPYADIIIHAATSTKQANYILNSNQEKENTQNGVSNYIGLAKKYHKNSKIVYCSSGAVYGNQPKDIFKIKEDFPFQNVSKISILKRDYTLSKRNAERLVLKSGKEGLKVSIARCFAFYGKYLPEDSHFAYSSFLKSAKRGEDIVINADHEIIRSYMHADDLVDSLIKIALSANESCPIYNVGSDKPISLFSLAQNIANEYNVKVVKKDLIDCNTIDRYVPNNDKLKELLKNYGI